MNKKEAILNAARRHGGITSPQAAIALDTGGFAHHSLSNANACIAGLVKTGHLLRTGETRGSYLWYQITGKPYTPKSGGASMKGGFTRRRRGTGAKAKAKAATKAATPLAPASIPPLAERLEALEETMLSLCTTMMDLCTDVADIRLEVTERETFLHELKERLP